MIKQSLAKLLDLLQPISAESKMFFIQHIGVMVKSGLPLHDALTTLAEEVEGKRFKKILTAVARTVSEGTSLSESLARYPDVFGELFTNMVRAGETSGKLEETLRELHMQLAKDHALRAKVKAALIYPSVIVVVMIGIAIFMMTVGMPRLISVFDDINVALPFATQMGIAISRFITRNGVLAAFLAVTITAGAILGLRHPQGKALAHHALLRSPIIGKIVKKINLAIFSRTLSSLLKTDIPFAQSLTITSSVVNNIHYHKAIAHFSDAVKQGITLEELLRKEPALFPPLVRQMVSVGEKTGTLDTILSDVATFYEAEVTNTMETLPALIEPLLIVTLGLGVAGLAVAVIMPMYSLAQQF